MASTVDLVDGQKNGGSHKKSATEKSFAEMNFKERFGYVREIVTVEPLIGCYVMASVLCGPALYNLEFEKACRVNFNYNDTVCEAVLSGEFENFTEQNDAIQVAISDMHSWQQPLQSIMPLILVLFLGSYSDRHKLRKPFLLLPIIGEFFAVAGCLLCVVFMREWPLEAQGIAQTVIPSFFGGQTMITMAVFAYIADVSTVEMRTLRIGIVQIVLNICYPLVQSFSGILFQQIGYVGILLLGLLLFAIGLIYGFFCIKEPATPVNMERKGLLVDIFDPRHAIDTFSLLIKKSPGNDRLVLLCIMLTLFISTGVLVGEFSLFYLFTQTSYQWTPVEYSYFITINTVVHLIGTALAVPLFTKVLNLNDFIIIIVSFLDKVASNVVFAFAKTVTILYVAMVISIINSVATIAIRSLATKIVAQDSLGKAQSLFGICEAIAPAISIPIYNKAIYVQTLDTFPGAFFFLGIILFGLSCVVLLWLYFREKRKSAGKTNGIAKSEGHVNTVALDEIQSTHM